MKQLYMTYSDIVHRCKANVFILQMALVAIVLSLVSCESLDDSIGSDPYGGGKEPLGIKLMSDAPVPDNGVPGDTVVFKAQGLLDWCNPASGRYDFAMYMGEERAQIIDATDTTLTVRVPQELSTGGTFLVLQNQVFYGPTFTVNGNLSIDREFGLFKKQDQFAGSIYDAVESNQKGQGGTFYLVGDMRYNVDGWNVCRGIALLNTNGDLTTNTNDYFRTTRGTVISLLDQNSAYLRSISLTDDNRMLVSGVFSNFNASFTWDQRNYLKNSEYLYANNVAMLSRSALMDTVQYVFSEGYNGSKYIPLPVPSFNGGFKQGVLKSFVTNADAVKNQKVIAVGNFTQYSYTDYQNSYYESDEVLKAVSGVCRMNLDGSLDASYRQGTAYTGANGNITDAYLDEDNGLVVIGDFDIFDGKKANGVVRLDANGNVDDVYMSHIGKGFNGTVTKVRYSKDTHSAIFVGRFTSVGNHQTQYVAKVGKDGIIDEKFSVSGFEGGVPSFGCIVSRQLPKVVVAGTFNIFKGVHRRGFLVLDMNGDVTQKFNVPGAFDGDIYQVKETETTHGEYGLLLLGNFTKFNGETVNNAVLLQADFK